MDPKKTPTEKTYKQKLLEIAFARINELTQFLKLMVDDSKSKQEWIFDM
jgi:hypothetical protein